MEHLGVIIQIGGAGKGCGKTTLICHLLELFPGADAYKSGRHEIPGENYEGDSQRFIRAGASRSGFYSSDRDSELLRVLKDAAGEEVLIFLEKNRDLEGLDPNLRIYMDVPVSEPRSDAVEMKARADHLVIGSKPEASLIGLIKTLLQRNRDSDQLR